MLHPQPPEQLTIIHLGVVDVAYSAAPAISVKAQSNKTTLRRRKSKKPQPAPKTSASGSFKTTGDVADILEAKYHVMEIFFELHENFIIGELKTSMEGALQNLALGAPPGSISLTAEAQSSIENDFRMFLGLREMDGLGYPGVPTQAALDGVSHRFLHPYAKRASRPSFIDTGLYQASFRAWVDN